MRDNFSYKLTLSYKGTNYRGWQIHPDNQQTIQYYVEQVLMNISDYKEFKLICAGRTDAGVHASAQVLKVVLPINLHPDKLLIGMNSKLPNDIRVTNCQYIFTAFNPNIDSKLKEYHYYFSDSQCMNASMNEIVHYHPQKLDIELMKRASSLFKGNHNFRGYCSKSKTQNHMRNISHCSINKTSFSPLDNDIYYLRIQSSGFLTYMVRFIMGALLNIAENKVKIDDIKKSLLTGESLAMRTKAQARGLHLHKVYY